MCILKERLLLQKIKIKIDEDIFVQNRYYLGSKYVFFRLKTGEGLEPMWRSF